MQTNLPAAAAARRRYALLAAVLVTATIYIIEGILVRSPRFELHPQLLGGAVVFDLTVSVPFLYWLLIVRPGHARASSILAVFLASLLGARLLLPAAQHQLLTYERLLVAPLELGVIAYVIVKIRRTARGLRGAPTALDVPERIAAALHDVFPAPIVGRLLATELALGWYALASWRRAPHVPAEAMAFSYHRRNGLVAILSALVAISVVELGIVHLLVQSRSPRAAWVLSAVSVIGIVWLVGFVRSLVLRPVLLFPDRLVARGGIQWTAEIPRETIESVETGSAVRVPAKGSPGYLRTTPVAQPNLVIRLRREVEARGMYGLRRMVRTVSLSVDEPGALADWLSDGREKQPFPGG